MQDFIAAHATHPDPGVALAMAAAQLDAQRASRRGGFAPTLGWMYFTDRCADGAEALLAGVRRRWPDVAWIGCTGVGIAASGVEYFDQPAVSLMQAELPRGDFVLFSGRSPPADDFAWSAQVHGDGATPDIDELVAEVCARTESGCLFGGLASSRSRTVHIADGVFEGGISGVGFSHRIGLVSRVTQGCQPTSAPHRVTAAEGNLVLGLDGHPALPQLLADLKVGLDDPYRALPALRATLIGLTDRDEAALAHGQFGADTRVRHLIGIDPARQGIAIADLAPVGAQLTFCRREREAARRDLVRICTEIREEIEADVAVPALAGDGREAAPRRIHGAIYVSCVGRGGPHFGAPSAELKIVRHALGDVPLAGFFGAGEIAGRHLYGYTGVLTVFVSP